MFMMSFPLKIVGILLLLAVNASSNSSSSIGDNDNNNNNAESTIPSIISTTSESSENKEAELSIRNKFKRVNLDTNRTNEKMNRNMEQRIKIPLNTNIVDVLLTKNANEDYYHGGSRRTRTARRSFMDDGDGNGGDNHNHAKNGGNTSGGSARASSRGARQFEIEALDEEEETFHQNEHNNTTSHNNPTSNNNTDNNGNNSNTTNSTNKNSSRIAKLMVQEIETMAITSDTTFYFKNHWEGIYYNDSSNNNTYYYQNIIQKFTILASNLNDNDEEEETTSRSTSTSPRSSPTLTIMSINKSNGQVRGFQRGRLGGHVREISMNSNSSSSNNNDVSGGDDNGDGGESSSSFVLRLKKSSNENNNVKTRRNNWTCDAVHPHGGGTLDGFQVFDNDDDDDDTHSHNRALLSSEQHGHDQKHVTKRRTETTTIKNSLNIVDNTKESITRQEEGAHSDPSSSSDGEKYSSPQRSLKFDESPLWIEPKSYSFHVDISIDIDKYFIEKQGGNVEDVVEYINFLVSAANVIFEHEVDAHLNIVHIQETDLYDTLSTTKEALRTMRLQQEIANNNDNNDDSNNKGKSNKIILYHAMLGRYLGGGIAFIDTICDSKWGFGVTSDLSGTLREIDENVLFDFFIFIHEVGHSLGAGHTFDAFDPPVDVCNVCAESPGENIAVDGLPLENSATIMSYCNFCAGGLPNVATTLGGVWKGAEPRSEVSSWLNNPSIVGSVSTEPRRVSHIVWQRLSSKGECVQPPSKLAHVQGCNDASDCDDNNHCSVDTCDANVCVVSEILDNCCGNGLCEFGEGDNCVTDCGPFTIQPTNFCEQCYALDGFMFDVGLSDSAEKRVFISSISLMHSSPTYTNATIDIFVTSSGSYVGQEYSVTAWERIRTMNVSAIDPGFIDITLDNFIPLGIGRKQGFYLAASENIVLFGEGVYSVKDENEVELFSSRAVTGTFGDGVDGFSLSCKVNYILDDAMSFPTVDPTESPTSEPSVNPTKNPTSLVSKSTSASATSFGLPNNGNGAIASAPNPPTTSPFSRNQADEKLKMYTSEATKSSIAIGIGFVAISLLLAQLFCFTE